MPRTTKNAVHGIINTGLRIGTVFRSEQRNLAKRPAEFQKIYCGKLWSLHIRTHTQRQSHFPGLLGLARGPAKMYNITHTHTHGDLMAIIPSERGLASSLSTLIIHPV